MGQMGFSPLGGMNPRTPGYTDVVPPNVGGFPQPPPQPRVPSTTTAATAPPTTAAPTETTQQQPILPKITPAPRTPAVRVSFDPSSFRKKLTTGFEEVTFPYFGPSPIPAQPKTTALAIFSYLSNKDASQAALVCKTWKSLAEDEELWKFP
jgi:F-box-like